MLTAQHLAKSETIDVTLNKAFFNKTDLPFDSIASCLPVILTDEISGIKATVDFDTKLGEFTFDINSEPFENHLFLDPSFCKDDRKAKVINAKIYLNKKIISEHGKEWLPASL